MGEAMMGVIINAIVGWINTLLGKEIEGRQTAIQSRRQDLVRWRDELIDLRTEYEQFLAKVDGKDLKALKTEFGQEHARIVGKAIGICLATNDDILKSLVSDPLGGHSYENQYDAEKTFTTSFIAKYPLITSPLDPLTDFKDQNRDTFNKAISRIAQIISEMSRSQ